MRWFFCKECKQWRLVKDGIAACCPECNKPLLKTIDTAKEEGCPHYQGVCGLDERYICYRGSSFKTCDIYHKYIKGEPNE